MKILLTIILFTTASSVFADTYVKGHTRRDGTYVEPHYRSSPDSSKFNNYSTQGNINPYTSKEGSSDPYALPNNSYQQPKSYEYKNPYDVN